MMEKCPLVSILVPVYHVERFIERCVRSIFEQTYNNLEFLFVDDASEDLSIDILKRVLLDYPARFDKVHIIRHQKHKGLAAARNTAVSACKGEFILHVDSDDWVEPNAVELLVKKQQETDSDIISAEAFVYKNGIKSRYFSGGWNLDSETLLVHLLTHKVSTTIWRRLIRRSLYIDNNITCDERGSYGEDFQAFPRLVYYANKVSGIENCIYNYDRSNQHSYTKNRYKYVDFQIQDLISVKVIVSFFSDKEKYLKELVSGMDIMDIHSKMLINAIRKNKIGFIVFLNLMKESDPQYWNKVQWNYSLVRFWESNYYLMMSLQSCKKNRVRCYFRKLFRKR